jgi:hypothetical protein
MAFIETPNGVIKVRETKTFNQVQTENAAAKAAGIVQFTACGVPYETTLPVSKKESVITLEKENGETL